MCPHIRRSQRARQGRQRRLGVARYLPTGKLDTTFGTGGLASAGYVGGESGTGVALQPDGKIIWVGSQGNPSFPAGGTFGFAVARFNANGSLDTSFGSGGQAGVEFFAPPMQGTRWRVSTSTAPWTPASELAGRSSPAAAGSPRWAWTQPATSSRSPTAPSSALPRAGRRGCPGR